MEDTNAGAVLGAVHETENALRARERELDIRELKLVAREEMAKRNFSEDCSELVDYTSRESCLKSIDRLDRLIQSEAARRVEKALASKGALPSGAAKIDPDSLSDREYYMMTIKRR